MQLSRRTVLGGAACIGSTWKSALAQELVPRSAKSLCRDLVPFRLPRSAWIAVRPRLGELFVVRNAGNTIDTAAMGSLEYAVGAL